MIEKYLHTTFSDVRVNGEWFRLTEDHLAMVDSIANPNSPRDLPKEIQERHKEQLFRQGAEVICPNLPVPKFDSVDTTPRAGMTNEDVIAAVALLKGIGPLDWIAENISQALSLTYSKSKLDGITLAFMVTADLSREIIKKTYGIHSF